MSQKTDEYLAIHEERYRVLLQTIAGLHLSANAKILDVGCYPLHIFNKLKSQGYEMYGIASHHESVSEKNIKVVDIEREVLPHSDNTFDLILFTEVLEHMAHSPDFFMSEFKRVLKKGGKIIITTPNFVNLKNRTKVALGKTTYFPLFQLTETTPKNGFIYHRHNREYVLEEVCDVAEAVGLSIVKAGHYSAYTPFRNERSKKQPHFKKMLKTVGYYITQAVPKLRDSLLVIAEKK